MSQPDWIIYADDAIVVLNKPAGLLCVPGRGTDKQDCLASRVQQVCSQACIVHRLDMATSGLLVMACNKEHQRTLSMAFAAREVEKTYIAHVAGCPRQTVGQIDLPLITDWPNRPRQMVDPVLGKPSLTRWKRLKAAPHKTSAYLQLEPYTGRTHQLRLHLAAIGHPILGDTLYAPPEFLYPYPRLMLQAQRLAFVHPITKKWLNFQLPLKIKN